MIGTDNFRDERGFPNMQQAVRKLKKQNKITYQDHTLSTRHVFINSNISALHLL